MIDPDSSTAPPPDADDAQQHGARPGDPREDDARETERARARLTGTPAYTRPLRRFWRALPSSPRCKMCTSPFGGPFAPVMRAIGKGPWPNNPSYCGGCFKDLRANRSGAEVEASLLFADVRGSTAMAEHMRPSEFRTFMDRFYRIASDRLIAHEAIVDKFVGDEVVAIFIPALTGGTHAAQAIAAGRELLAAVGAGRALDVPIGIGINTGIAYVGAVGTEEHVEMTAMGDPVNVAARLAAAAGPGELLVSASTVAAAGLDDPAAERRRLELKGKSEPVDVLVLTAA